MDIKPALISIRKVQIGTILKSADGFTCIPKGASRMVFQDWKIPGRNGLYVRCDHGRHYLDGQLDNSGKNYVGFLLANKQHY